MYWVPILFLIAVLIILIWQILVKKTIRPTIPISGNATCSKHSCGALDPVNDPDYNMRNVVKQSILLEEHLAEKNKYCKGCIVKHFQHIIGMCEEAVWLAGKNIDKYPFLDESPSFYQKIFDKWLANKDDDKTRLEVLSLLRERRRQLIDVYFLKNTQ